MNITKIFPQSFLCALGTTAYIILVSLIMNKGEQIFGQTDGVAGPIAFLLLFVFSAALTGSLVLGKPVLLYLDGKKKESIQMFLTTLGWLLIMTMLALVLSVA
ncbi:MAG: hypothetical protein PHS07_02905 [Patescibacteria group bacterium]|jgi:hypothetical protein|nr:hypothetical protein [Patescibacteria group bacterium]